MTIIIIIIIIIMMIMMILTKINENVLLCTKIITTKFLKWNFVLI